MSKEEKNNEEMKGIKFNIKSENEQQKINEAMTKLCNSSKIKMLKHFGMRVEYQEKESECSVLFYISKHYFPFLEKITKNFEKTVKELDSEAKMNMDFIL